MPTTLYNPQKGRLETVAIEFTAANTTWFNASAYYHGICSITDYKGGLIIRNCGYNYPVWIYDVSRASIGYRRNRAFKLLKAYLKA
jgi:hypothetical protein